jgi:hypothetical protein
MLARFARHNSTDPGEGLPLSSRMGGP